MKLDKDFLSVLEQVAFERSLPIEKILEAVQEAVSVAYKRDYGSADQEIRVEIDQEEKKFRVFATKEIVNIPEDETMQIPLIMARALDPEVQLGQKIEVEVTPLGDYGRIASQSARQAIIQKFYEAEREQVAANYEKKVGEIVSGVVYEIARSGVIVTLEKAQAVIPYSGQIPREKYYIGQRLKCLLEKVDLEAKGAGQQIVLSRSNTEFIQKLFEMQVPELDEGSVQIVKISREAGRRTKLSVKSLQEGIDPVGTFVGQRGIRVRAVSDELGPEKLDLVAFDENNEVYIRNALSPAQVQKVEINESNKTAKLIVAEDQQALTIGRGGQNIRLAGQLTGYNLEVMSDEEDNSMKMITLADTKVILIHGDESGPENQWLPYAKEELEKLGIEVQSEQFPDAHSVSKDMWLQFLDALGVDKDTILVGHSCGSVAIMRYLEDHQAKGAILVGAYHTDLDDEMQKNSGCFDDEWNWKTIKSNVDWIIQYASKDDPYISFEEAEHIAENLETDFRVYEDEGHFGDDKVKKTEFPEIIEDIKNKLGVREETE